MSLHRYQHLIVKRLCAMAVFTLLVATTAGAQTLASAAADAPGASSNGSSLASGFRVLLVSAGYHSAPTDRTRANLIRRLSPDAFAAMIKTTLGGLRLPDGTQQKASAAAGPLFTVTHDETLQGDGTNASPLGIKVPLNLNGPLNLSGALTVGGNIRATTILSGNNFVSGLLDVGSLLRARGTTGNHAIEATGGDGSTEFPSGGLGVRGTGGKGIGEEGGRGLEGDGGDSDSGAGGIGVGAIGGRSISGAGGDGVLGRGGDSQSGTGGAGARAIGGNNDNGTAGTGVSAQGGFIFVSGNGGPGVSTVGGRGTGAGHSGGIGILASGGAGFAGATRGLAGRFEGDVEITGNLSKGGGSFKIDHPLDPENKYLSHSFVESPDMMNIYNGNVTTDANGDAVVELPRYFGALNRDFRYQLTVIGTFAQAIVAEKIKDNHFRIKTNSPNVEVSWQVTGIRQDAYANKNRIPVEQDKPEQERGLYLHPDAFGQPVEKSVLVVQHPDIMHQINEARDPSQKEKLR